MKKKSNFLRTVMLLVVAAAVLTCSAFAATGEATVNSYMLNMREGQGTEYTIIDVAYQGNTVLVTQDDGSGWVQVSFNGQTGYMNKLFLTFKEETPAVAQTYNAPAVTTVQAPAQTAAPAVTGDANGSILGDGVYMRSGPSLGSTVLEVMYTGTPIKVNGTCGAWKEVSYNGQTGYIYGDYVVMNGSSVTYTVTAATVEEPAPIYPEPATPEINAAPQETTVPVEQPAPAPVVEQPAALAPAAPAPAAPAPAPASGGSGQTIVDTAMQYLGTPYVWGGTSPEKGFDCSGLVYYVYGQNGYSLNRVAQNMYRNGSEADLNNLQAGDILLFGSSTSNIWHAGIYVGNGQFIHSPHSGAVVSVQALSSTYGMRLVAARRIV